MVTYLEQWFTDMPYITKGLAIIYILTGIVSEFMPSYVVSDYIGSSSKSILTYATTLLFFHRILTIYFLYEFILFVSYSKSLEYEYSHINRGKSYFFCLLIGTIIILLFSFIRPLKAVLLSRSFVFYIIYLYNNYKNPNDITTFLPGIVLENKYMTRAWIFANAWFGMFVWSEYLIGLAAAYLYVTLEQTRFVQTIFNSF